MPTGDPFEYYGQSNGHPDVTAESIMAATEAPASSAAQLTQIGQDLNADSKKVDIDVKGELVEAVQQPPVLVGLIASELALKATYAVAAMTQFADAVRAFDAGVTSLNERVEKKIQEYTAAPSGATPGGKVPDVMTPMEARAHAMGELDGEYAELWKPLNAAIEDVTNKLHNYKLANIKSLILAGYIPATSAGMYGVQLTSVEYQTALSIAVAREQARAFATTFGRPPISRTDWELAAVLDPTSRQAKNGDQKAVVVVARITPRPGAGLTRIGLYIPAASVFNFGNYDLGDNRGMDPNFDPEQTRVSFYVDWETGTVVARQNPSVDTSGEVRIDAPSIGISESSTGAIQITYKATNPFAPPDPTDSHHVEGTVVVTPTNGYPGSRPRVDGTIGDYPSFEAYHDSNDGKTTTLVQDAASDSEFGPLFDLPSHHDVGNSTGARSQFYEWLHLSGDDWVKGRTSAGVTTPGDPGNPPTVTPYEAFGGGLYHPDSEAVYAAPSGTHGKMI